MSNAAAAVVVTHGPEALAPAEDALAAPAAPRPRTRSRKGDTGADADAEVHALSQCIRLLSDLDDNAQSRVLMYLNRRFLPAMVITTQSVADRDGAIGA